MIEAGPVDELHLHLAPMLLGSGTPLSGRERGRCTANVTSLVGHSVHLIYERKVTAEEEAVRRSRRLPG